MIDAHEQEQQVKKLKRLLEGWRMALIPLKSVMLWEQQWHPCAIVGAVTTLYFIIWLMDLSTLATLAAFGALLNVIDFTVPIVFNSMYGANSWNGQKEQIFEDICKSIVKGYNKVLYGFRSFYCLRETSPILYYISSFSLLCMLTWLCSAVNNVFLLYILSTGMMLFPGFQQRGLFQTFLSLVKMGAKPLKAE